MNRALHKLTDEEREEQIAHDKILLFRPDMYQEPEPENDWNVIATVVVFYAVMALLLGAWIAWRAWE